MHSDGFGILLIPIMGLPAIFRGGKFHWRVTSDTLLNGMFWFGWLITLLGRLVRISGVA
jgi:hypothetical protein